MLNMGRIAEAAGISDIKLWLPISRNVDSLLHALATLALNLTPTKPPRQLFGQDVTSPLFRQALRGWHLLARLLNAMLPVMDPACPVRIAWSIWVLVFVLYTAVATPLQIAFSSFHTHTLAHVLGILSTVTFKCALNIVFVIRWFRTAYMTARGELVRTPTLIAAHYVTRGMFFPDLLSALPVEAVLGFVAAGGSNGYSSLYWLGLLKLPRMFLLMRHLTVLTPVRFENLVSVVRLLLTMLMVTHWAGCLWYYLYIQVPGWPWVFNIDCLGWTDWEKYQHAFYKCFLMILGDRPDAHNNVERLFSIALMSLGACLYAVVMSSMTLLVSNMWGMSSRHKQRAAMLQDALRYSGVRASDPARAKIHDYFSHMIQYDHPGPDGVSFLSELPAALHAEVLSSVFEPMLIRIQLFMFCEQPFIWRLARQLRLALFMTRGVIYDAGSVGHEMYIIWKGTVALVGPDGCMTALLCEGEHFGELGVMTSNMPRPHTAVALQPTDVMVLNRSDMNDAMRDFPDSAQLVKSRARVQLEDHEVGQAVWLAAAGARDAAQPQEQEPSTAGAPAAAAALMARTDLLSLTGADAKMQPEPPQPPSPPPSSPPPQRWPQPPPVQQLEQAVSFAPASSPVERLPAASNGGGFNCRQRSSPGGAAAGVGLPGGGAPSSSGEEQPLLSCIISAPSCLQQRPPLPPRALPWPSRGVPLGEATEQGFVAQRSETSAESSSARRRRSSWRGSDSSEDSLFTSFFRKHSGGEPAQPAPDGSQAPAAARAAQTRPLPGKAPPSREGHAAQPPLAGARAHSGSRSQEQSPAASAPRLNGQRPASQTAGHGSAASPGPPGFIGADRGAVPRLPSVDAQQQQQQQQSTWQGRLLELAESHTLHPPPQPPLQPQPRTTPPGASFTGANTCSATGMFPCGTTSAAAAAATAAAAYPLLQPLFGLATRGGLQQHAHLPPRPDGNHRQLEPAATAVQPYQARLMRGIQEALSASDRDDAAASRFAGACLRDPAADSGSSEGADSFCSRSSSSDGSAGSGVSEGETTAPQMLALPPQPFLGLDPLLAESGKGLTGAASRRRVRTVLTAAEDAGPQASVTLSGLEEGAGGRSFERRRPAPSPVASRRFKMSNRSSAVSTRVSISSNGKLPTDTGFRDCPTGTVREHSGGCLQQGWMGEHVGVFDGGGGSGSCNYARCVALEQALLQTRRQLEESQAQVAAMAEKPLMFPAIRAVLQKEVDANAAELKAKMETSLQRLLEMLLSLMARTDDVCQQAVVLEDRVRWLEEEADGFHAQSDTVAATLGIGRASAAGAGVLGAGDGPIDGLGGGMTGRSPGVMSTGQLGMLLLPLSATTESLSGGRVLGDGSAMKRSLTATNRQQSRRQRHQAAVSALDNLMAAPPDGAEARADAAAAAAAAIAPAATPRATAAAAAGADGGAVVMDRTKTIRRRVSTLFLSLMAASSSISDAAAASGGGGGFMHRQQQQQQQQQEDEHQEHPQAQLRKEPSKRGVLDRTLLSSDMDAAPLHDSSTHIPRQPFIPAGASAAADISTRGGGGGGGFPADTSARGSGGGFWPDSCDVSVRNCASTAGRRSLMRRRANAQAFAAPAAHQQLMLTTAVDLEVADLAAAAGGVGGAGRLEGGSVRNGRPVAAAAAISRVGPCSAPGYATPSAGSGGASAGTGGVWAPSLEITPLLPNQVPGDNHGGLTSPASPCAGVTAGVGGSYRQQLPSLLSIALSKGCPGGGSRDGSSRFGSRVGSGRPNSGQEADSG